MCSLCGVMGKRKCAEYGGAVVTCFSFFFGSLIVLAFILVTHIPAVANAIIAAGLPNFANGGVGLLVLFRMNGSLKKNISVTALMWALGVFWGVVARIRSL